MRVLSDQLEVGAGSQVEGIGDTWSWTGQEEQVLVGALDVQSRPLSLNIWLVAALLPRFLGILL